MPTGTLSAAPPSSAPLWTFQVGAVEGSDRRFWGEASSPGVDTQNEIVEQAALEAALEAFMALPVVDFFHTGIPVGLVTKAWWKGDRLRIEGRLKPTPDCDPVWQGMKDGILTELSIWGKRTAGTPECRLRPDQRSRSRPCVTKAIRMYTISICPRGSAVNRDAWVRPGDADDSLETLVRKATTSTGSALIHPTVDGAAHQKREDDMPNLNRDEDDEQRTTPPMEGDAPPEDLPPTDEEEVQKTEEEIVTEPPEAPAEPTMADVMGVLEKILAAVGGPAGGDAPPAPDDVMKAQNRLLEVETELQAMKKENERLRKAIVPPKQIVIDSSKNPTTPDGGSDVVRRNSRLENVLR